MKRMGCSVGMLVDFIANMALETAKKKFEGKIDESRLKKAVYDFVESQKKYQEAVAVCDEIDYAGLMDFLSDKYLNLVVDRCFCVNPKQRKAAREEVVSAACSYCNANSAEAQKRVETIIYNCLDIIRNFFKSDVNVKEYLLAGDIVDGVTEVINEKLEPIQGNVSEINDSLKLLTIYSPEAYAKLAKNGNLEEIQNRFDSIFYSMNKQHPLYPDFGYQMRGRELISWPLTQDAEKKYPPRYLCNGKLYIGEQIISPGDVSKMDILDYADRHQLQLKLEMHDVVKLLGEREDPSQVEAKILEGQVIVREPKEFPPAIACSIIVKQETIFEYLELRTKEILDDGTYIIDNSEQKNCHIYIMIRTKMMQNGRVDFTLNLNNASNQELLRYVQFMKSASEGIEVAVKVLSVGEILCSGIVNTASYNCGFVSIDEELQFLKDVCEIEKYVGHDIKVPKEIAEKQMRALSYLAGLIRGEEQPFSWKELSIVGTVDDTFRKRLAEMGTDEYEVSFVSSFDMPLFDQSVHISLVRRFDHAIVSNYDKMMKKLEVLDDGDSIKLSFTNLGNDSGADYLNSTDIKTESKYVECYAKKRKKNE